MYNPFEITIEKHIAALVDVLQHLERADRMLNARTTSVPDKDAEVIRSAWSSISNLLAHAMVRAALLKPERKAAM